MAELNQAWSDVEARRGCSLDLPQKIQEFLGPVALGRPPDDLAGGHIEGGVQTGGAVNLVIVRAPLDLARA